MTDRCDVPHFDNSIQPTTPVLTAYSHAHYDTATRAVYTSLILSTLLYGCECWALTERLLHRLRVFHAHTVRACDVSCHSQARVGAPHHDWRTLRQARSRLGAPSLTNSHTVRCPCCCNFFNETLRARKSAYFANPGTGQIPRPSASHPVWNPGTTDARRAPHAAHAVGAAGTALLECDRGGLVVRLHSTQLRSQRSVQLREIQKPQTGLVLLPRDPCARSTANKWRDCTHRHDNGCDLPRSLGTA